MKIDVRTRGNVVAKTSQELIQVFRFFYFIALMNDGQDDVLLAAFRRYDRPGGNPLFQTIFTTAGRNRSFHGIVHQKKFRLTFLQLPTTEENKPLGEALAKAIRQGLEQVVESEQINTAQYSLLMAIHSNSLPIPGHNRHLMFLYMNG